MASVTFEMTKKFINSALEIDELKRLFKRMLKK